MDNVEDDDEELEPSWPGWRAMASGRAGAIALVLLIVGAFVAYSLVSQQEEFNSPAHTQVVCVPLDKMTDGAGGAVAGPTQICVTGHS